MISSSPEGGREALVENQEGGTEPLVCVVSGTHSAGKSTLLEDVEKGKIAELGIVGPEYSDFGYGVLNDSESDRKIIVVTVPEAARWLAVDVLDRPELLAGEYTLDNQLAIDAQVIFRTHEAIRIAREHSHKLMRGDEEAYHDRPVVLSDRSALDGVVYSEERVGDTNLINGFPRTGFLSEWMKRYVDIAFIVDHEEVALRIDEARLDDIEFRNCVAQRILAGYTGLLDGYVDVSKLSGDRTQRVSRLAEKVSQVLRNPREPQKSTPYSEWPQVCLPVVT